MKRWWGVALSVGSLGCVHAPATGSDVDTGYKRAVVSWTAKAEIYQFADERAHFLATIESRTFREQRVRERAHELGWSAATELAESDKETKAEAIETSFIVAAYTEVPRENDLGGPKSIWRIVLQTPAGEVLPTSVDRLGRPDDNMTALYPYMDRYITAYRVHFPKTTQGPVILLIASGLGKAELKFDQL